MSGTLRDKRQLHIAAEASEWLNVLARQQFDDHQAFADWITESRLHVEEFLIATAIDQTLNRIDPHRRLDVEKIIAKAKGNVVPLPNELPLSLRSAPTSRKNPWSLLVKAAASICAVAVAIGLSIYALSAGDYRTASGEQRTIELPDGSAIYMNTQSRARVRYTTDAREIELLKGEALFKVERDAARPFRVRAGNVTVQALGTQFNVYKRNDSLQVAVIEGAIRVSTPHESSQLSATPERNMGEQAQIEKSGEIAPRQPVDIQRVTGWRQYRLMFSADTLEDIAAEFNRYNRSLQIRLVGDDLRGRRFTGVFNANDPRALAQFLETYADLSVEERADEILIRSTGALH